MTQLPPACKQTHDEVAAGSPVSALVSQMDYFGVCHHSEGAARNVTKSQMFAQDCSEEELRVVCEGLFVAQGDHGVDSHGAARGDVAMHVSRRSSSRISHPK